MLFYVVLLVGQCWATFAFSASADLFEVVDFSTCCTSFHMPGIVWAGEWTHSTCISVSWVFCSVLVIVSHFAFANCFLQIFCQSLLLCLNFLGWLIVSFVLQLFLPMPGLAHCHISVFIYFCELFYYFYTHFIVIWHMYNLFFQLPIDFPVVTSSGSYS